jgi:phenylacetate-coenzyme A ligase PaaK-like adenylate-forming protein
VDGRGKDQICCFYQPATPRKDGNILVTSLTHELMPIIRYELGDVGYHYWVF